MRVSCDLQISKEMVSNADVHKPTVFFNAAKFISHILGGNSTLHQDFSSLLSSVTSPESRWTRCYRAVDDVWSAAAFHANCDDRGASVTLVKVDGYIFGGYLDRSWGGKYGMFLALRLFRLVYNLPI